MNNPEITAYSDGLSVSRTEQYVDQSTSLAVRRVSVDQNWLIKQIDVRVEHLLKAEVFGAVAKEKFEEFAQRIVFRLREHLSRDIAAMGAKGRLGFDDEQLELLQAAIEGRANEALAALQSKDAKAEAAPPPDDLADPIGGVNPGGPPWRHP